MMRREESASGRSESARLRALALSGVLESGPDPLYDTIANIAAQTSGCPVALLSFLDSDQEIIKGRFRWNVAQFPRDRSFGFGVLREGTALVVPDAAASDEFRENPLVVGEPRVRFYAGVPIQDAAGEIVGVLSVFDRAARDISSVQLETLQQLARTVSQHIETKARLTELSETVSSLDDVEQQLRERDERFREIFDSVDDLIMTIRPDGRVMHFNASCPHRLGVPAQELTGRSIIDLVHPASRESFRSEFDRIVENGVAEAVETAFVDSNGQKLIVDGTLSPKVVDGYSVLVRVIFRDITDRKRSEVELGRTRDEALESARLKNEFLSNVSHEVRTPIHAIVGMLGLLSDTELTTEQQDFVNSARSAADSLLQTINNILYVARLESGKLTSNLVDFDLLGTVHRVVDVMQIAAQEKNLELDVSIGAGIPAILRGDPGRYRQVLTNLVGNAIKFTESGRVDISVTPEKQTESHLFVRLEVRDTGIGIPESARSRIFTTFSQADSSASRSHEGMGLGLSIARQLVDLMGGAIGYDTSEGKGTTFWVTVPFEQRSEEMLAATDSKVAFPGTRVLILDSSETNRKLIEHFVSSWGMRSRTVASANEAKQRLIMDADLGDPFQIVVAELHYPDENVLDLVRAIKADDHLGEVGVIVTVPIGETVNDEAFRRIGVASYLPRPVERSDLFDCLTIALAKGARSLAEIGDTTIRNESSGPVPEVPLERRAEIAILLAEDKPLNQKLTLSQLKSLGYTADIAVNGVEVVDAVKTRGYDVIFMDCQMPMMDGYEATIQVRRLEGGTKRSHIIAMTANALEGDREKCLAAGMDDYLSKPTRREDLEAALARAIAAS